MNRDISRRGMILGALALAGCGGGSSPGPTPSPSPTPGPSPGPTRGSVVSVEFLETISRDFATFQLGLAGLAGLSALGPASRGVVLHKLRYRTVDSRGALQIASALLIVPEGASGATPLVSYQHGTVTKRDDVPSRRNLEGILVALSLGTRGFAIVCPDYHGLGDSPGFHPYLHAQSTVDACSDAIVAVRRAAGSLGVSLDGPLSLAGYSQGGHATLALQRALEATGQALRCVVAGAGPYDLNHVVVPDLFARESKLGGLYIGYVLLGYDSVHNLFSDLSEAIHPEKVAALLAALDGTRAIDDATNLLDALPSQLLTGSFLAENRDNPDSPLRRLLAQNSVIDYTPRAPLLLAHARSDEIVAFENTIVARDTFLARGANVTFVDLGDNLTHAGAVRDALPAVIPFLEQHGRA